MKPELDIQRIVESPDDPCDGDFEAWVSAALTAAGIHEAAELTLRLVDEEEIQTLNREYREKDYATNVLSFPADLPPEVQKLLPARLLGDIVICGAVVRREALEQGKKLQAHWAHMVVHGCLHLLGYDHMTVEDAAEMEPLEIRILAALDVADPYE